MPDLVKSFTKQMQEKYVAAPFEKNNYTNLAALELEKKAFGGAFTTPKIVCSGAQALPLQEAAETFTKEVAYALGKIASRTVPGEHKFFARAKAEFSHAYFINVEDGAKAKVRLSFPENKGTGRGGFPTFLTIVNLGENSSAEVFEQTSLVQGANVSEIVCASNSIAEFVSLHDAEITPKENAFLSHKRFFIGENANASAYSAFLGGGLLKCETEMLLEGKGAFSRDAQAAFPSATQHFDLSSTARHLAPSTTAHSIAKSVLMDQGRAVLWGKIDIAKGAKLSDSFLSQNAIILNAGARADAMPVLEIEENDVRATHASSVSHIDENALFYLNSRGISSSEAKKAIAASLLESAFEKTGQQEAKASLEELVEKKWN